MKMSVSPTAMVPIGGMVLRMPVKLLTPTNLRLATAKTRKMISATMKMTRSRLTNRRPTNDCQPERAGGGNSLSASIAPVSTSSARLKRSGEVGMEALTLRRLGMLAAGIALAAPLLALPALAGGGFDVVALG